MLPLYRLRSSDFRAYYRIVSGDVIILAITHKKDSGKKHSLGNTTLRSIQDAPYLSSISRIFWRSSSNNSGLAMKSNSPLSIPLSRTISFVYPLMNRTLI